MPVHAEQKEEGAIAAVKKGMALLDRHLTKNTYLVGHTATLADIVGVCNLYHGYTKVQSCSCLKYCQMALDVGAWCSWRIKSWKLALWCWPLLTHNKNAAWD